MPDVREFESVMAEAERAARDGQAARAELLLREALRLQLAALGPSHPDLASTLNNLAVVCESTGRLDDAEAFYRQAYAVASSSRPPGDPLVITSRDNLRDFCAARSRAFEDWPGLGEASAPTPPAAASLPPVAIPAAASTRPDPVVASRTVPPSTSPRVPTSPASPAAGPTSPRPSARWAVGALVAVAVGAAVALGVFRPVSPAKAPDAVPVAPVRSAATDRPVRSPRPGTDAPGLQPPASDKPVAPTAPSPRDAPAPPAPSLAPAASAARPPDTTVGDVRVLVSQVCTTLSTGGAWRCDPAGASPAPARLSYYTRIAAPRALRVQHRWYQGDTLRQNVTLSIAANPSAGYRTFSRQTVTPGPWRVELRTSDGVVLHEASFDVR